jgi:hypothetical protein
MKSIYIDPYIAKVANSSLLFFCDINKSDKEI